MDGTPIHEGDVLELDIARQRSGTGTDNPYTPLLGTVYYEGGCYMIKTSFAYNWAHLHQMAGKSRIYKEPVNAKKTEAP